MTLTATCHRVDIHCGNKNQFNILTSESDKRIFSSRGSDLGHLRCEQVKHLDSLNTRETRRSGVNDYVIIQMVNGSACTIELWMHLGVC